MRMGGCRTRVRRGVWHRRSCPHVGATPEFFFFFFFEIHANSAPIHTDSARIRSYQLNWIVSASGRDWPKQPKNAEIGFEWGPNILNLSFLNFILNICCFFCVFFFVLCFVLCFSPSSFFVLWTKAIVMCFLRIF